MRIWEHINGVNRGYTQRRISEIVHMEPEEELSIICNMCGEDLNAYRVSISPGSNSPAIYIDPCEYCDAT